MEHPGEAIREAEGDIERGWSAYADGIVVDSEEEGMVEKVLRLEL